MADAQHLGCCAARRQGSNPCFPTNNTFSSRYQNLKSKTIFKRAITTFPTTVTARPDQIEIGLTLKNRITAVAHKYIFILLLLATYCLMPVACTGESTVGQPGQEHSGPQIRIISPENFATIQTTVNTRHIKVQVATANFSLVSKSGEPNVAGEGYIIYYLDVNPPTIPGQPAFTAVGTCVPAVTTSHQWRNLSDGPHMLAVELVNNDGTPLSPPATDWIQVYLQSNILAPSVRIISPKNGEKIPAGNISVSIAFRNFVVSNRLGAPNLSGQGHFHYFIDVAPPIESGKVAETAAGTWAESLEETFTWNNVSPGMHTLAVELVTNDHMPLYPPSLRPAYDEVSVIVEPAS
jgi:hypothetical protein